jgi:hypothetical protein
MLNTKYYLGDQIEDVCRTYRREEKCLQVIGGGDLKQRERLEDQRVDGSMILK